MLRIFVDEDKCTGCGKCKDICPKGQIIWKINKIAHASNLKYCHICTLCASRCPEGAILVDRDGPNDAEGIEQNRLVPIN
ncbi:MAG: 4Fe-4S binding protein [Methanobrevibacter sp.]|nr:4Fe-4S binding protein [Candidatus Methanoflexus mossambicus]